MPFETQGLRETLDHKDPPVRRVLKAFKVSRVFRVLPVLQAPRDLRARPVRRVTKEKKAKLQLSVFERSKPMVR